MVRTSPTLALRGLIFLMTGALASAFFFVDFFVDFAATTAPPGCSGGLTAACAAAGSAIRREVERATTSRRVIAAFIGPALNRLEPSGRSGRGLDACTT